MAETMLAGNRLSLQKLSVRKLYKQNAIERMRLIL